MHEQEAEQARQRREPWALETLKTVHSDTPPNFFPNSSTNWGPSPQIYEPLEPILIQTTERLLSLSHTDIFLRLLVEIK